MKRIYLTSVASVMLDAFVKLLGHNPSELTVAFIANAADLYHDKWFVEEDKNKLIELGFHIVNVDIKHETHLDISKKLKDSDIVFVAWGNLFYLLQEMKRNEVDVLIKEFVENGKIYIGSSAWSIVVGPNIEIIQSIDDSDKAPELKSYTWLNLINYVIIPHCNNKKFKDKIDKVLENNIEYDYPIIKLNDNQAVFIEWNQIRFIENNNKL